MTQLALGYPEVGFTLMSAGRRVLQCAPASNVGERFFQVYGDRPNLIEVRQEVAGHCQLGLLLAELPHAQLPRIPVSP